MHITFFALVLTGAPGDVAWCASLKWNKPDLLRGTWLYELLQGYCAERIKQTLHAISRGRPRNRRCRRARRRIETIKPKWLANYTLAAVNIPGRPAQVKSMCGKPCYLTSSYATRKYLSLLHLSSLSVRKCAFFQMIRCPFLAGGAPAHQLCAALIIIPF